MKRLQDEIEKAALQLNERLWSRGLTAATAESCTGGGVAAAITSIAGSSQGFKGGIVAYANEVKQQVLGVREETLLQYGAVSEHTVRQMVQGVARLMQTDYAVATSGVAGPGGGTPQKPVGMVWLAAGNEKEQVTKLLMMEDKGRGENVSRAILEALRLLCEVVANGEK